MLGRMPRRATGSTFKDRAGRWYARVTLGSTAKDRPAFALPNGFTEAQATVRKDVLADLAARLRAGHVPRGLTEPLLAKLAAAEGARFGDVQRAAERILSGEVPIARGLDRD